MSVHPLNVLDAAVLLILGWNVLRGFNKGFLEEILSITGIIISIVVALKLSRPVASFLSLSSSTQVALIGFSIYLVSFLIFKYLAFNINARISRGSIGILNNVLGFMFGIVRGFILSSFLILFIGASIPNSYLIRKSYLSGFFVPVSDWVMKFLPDSKVTREAEDNWKRARAYLLKNRSRWRETPSKSK